MHDKITIRPFTWDMGWSALWRLRTHQLHENGIFPLADEDDIEVPAEPDLSSPYEQDYHRIAEVYLRAKGGFWLAWLGETPAGHIGGQDMGHAIELRRMYVQAAYRRRSIGKQLVETLCQHCQACNIRAIELWTDEDGPGRVLYTRLGFARVDRPGGEFKDIPMRNDQIRMRKEL